MLDEGPEASQQLFPGNLGNLWRRLALPKRIENWSLTSLQQRPVKTGGRLVKHARYYWLPAPIVLMFAGAVGMSNARTVSVISRLRSFGASAERSRLPKHWSVHSGALRGCTPGGGSDPGIVLPIWESRKLG